MEDNFNEESLKTTTEKPNENRTYIVPVNLAHGSHGIVNKVVGKLNYEFKKRLKRSGNILAAFEYEPAHNKECNQYNINQQKTNM